MTPEMRDVAQCPMTIAMRSPIIHKRWICLVYLSLLLHSSFQSSVAASLSTAQSKYRASVDYKRHQLNCWPHLVETHFRLFTILYKLKLSNPGPSWRQCLRRAAWTADLRRQTKWGTWQLSNDTLFGTKATLKKTNEIHEHFEKAIPHFLQTK